MAAAAAAADCARRRSRARLSDGARARTADDGGSDSGGSWRLVSGK